MLLLNLFNTMQQSAFKSNQTKHSKQWIKYRGAYQIWFLNQMCSYCLKNLTQCFKVCKITPKSYRTLASVWTFEWWAIKTDFHFSLWTIESPTGKNASSLKSLVIMEHSSFLHTFKKQNHQNFSKIAYSLLRESLTSWKYLGELVDLSEPCKIRCSGDLA